MNAVTRYTNELAVKLYGWTSAEAHKARQCIRCRKDIVPDDMERLDYLEYHLTALCPACFHDVTEDPADVA